MLSRSTHAAHGSRPAQSLARFGLIALICLCVLAPPITISANSLWVRAEQLLLPLFIGVYGLFLLMGCVKPIQWNGMFLAAAAFCVCILLSIWYGSAALHHTVLLSDFFELPKAWLPVIFFTIGCEAELSEDSLRRLLNWFTVAILLVCLYAWAQWMDLGITLPLNLLYSSGNHDDVLKSVRRVYSTMGNANVLGELMVWSIVAFILRALSRTENLAANLAIAFACMVTTAMTASRYALINTVSGIALIFLPPCSFGSKGAQRKGLLLALIPAFLIVIFAVAISNPRTSDRFKTLQNPLQVDSLRERLDDTWVDATAAFMQSPIVGNGPAKAIFSDFFTDSEDLDILKKYGVVGFIPYFCYFLIPIYLCWKGLQASRQSDPGILGSRLPITFLTLRLSFILAVTAIVMSIGMSTFNTPLLQAFLWVWLGIGARSAKVIADVSQAHVPLRSEVRGVTRAQVGPIRHYGA